MTLRPVLSLAGCLLLLASCATQLDAVRVSKKDPVPVAGAPYNLTFTRFDLVVTRRIRCYKQFTEAEIADRQERKLPLEVDLVTVKNEVAVTSAEVRDPQRNYVIDLESLNSFFKTTDVKVTYYDTGAIKTVNAEAEDKVGEFVASAATTFANLVVDASKVKAVPVKCKAEVAAADKGLEQKQKDLVLLTNTMALAAAQLNRYTSLAAVLGRNMSQLDRDALNKTFRDLTEMQARQERQQADIKHDLRLISVVDEVSWPSDGETFISTAPVLAPVDGEAMKAWVGVDEAPIRPLTAIFLQLETSEPIARDISCGAACTETQRKGLKYRMPAMGTLSMCDEVLVTPKTGATPETSSCAADKWTAVTKPALISQLGRMYTLPLKSTLFSKKSVSASFSENGVPTLLGLGASASSDKLASSLTGLSDAAIAVHASRAGREAAELESKIKLLKLKKEYQAAVGALAPPPDQTKQDATSVFAVDTALAGAELANIEAHKALEGAKKVQ